MSDPSKLPQVLSNDEDNEAGATNQSREARPASLLDCPSNNMNRPATKSNFANSPASSPSSMDERRYGDAPQPGDITSRKRAWQQATNDNYTGDTRNQPSNSLHHHAKLSLIQDEMRVNAAVAVASASARNSALSSSAASSLLQLGQGQCINGSMIHPQASLLPGALPVAAQLQLAAVSNRVGQGVINLPVPNGSSSMFLPQNGSVAWQHATLLGLSRSLPQDQTQPRAISLDAASLLHHQQSSSSISSLTPSLTGLLQHTSQTPAIQAQPTLERLQLRLFVAQQSQTNNNLSSQYLLFRQAQVQAQNINVAAGLPTQYYVPQAPSIHSVPSSTQSGLLDQLAIAQILNQSPVLASIKSALVQALVGLPNTGRLFQQPPSAVQQRNQYLAPALTTSPIMHNPLQQLGVAQTPSSFLPVNFSQGNQSQQLVQRLTQDEMAITYQLAADLILLQQQQQPTNVASMNTSTHSPSLATSNQMEIILQRIMSRANPDTASSSLAPTSGNQGKTPVAKEPTAGHAISKETQQFKSDDSITSHESTTLKPVVKGPANEKEVASDVTAAAQKAGKRDVRRKGKGDKWKEKRWMIRYEELMQFQQKHGHCRVPHGYTTNPKLSWWVMNQRAQYKPMTQGKKTWLTEDHVALLDELGFVWSPTLAKSEGS